MKFSCPHCGQRIEAGPEWVGHAVDCPKCGQNFTAPAMPADEAVLVPESQNPPGHSSSPLLGIALPATRPQPAAAPPPPQRPPPGAPYRPPLQPVSDYVPPIKKRGGGGFGGFLLFIVLLAVGGFGGAMYRFNESPQQVWARLAGFVDGSARLPKSPALASAPIPVPTPVPAELSAVTPTPTPTPDLEPRSGSPMATAEADDEAVESTTPTPRPEASASPVPQPVVANTWTPGTKPRATPVPRTDFGGAFNHPGGLHTKADLDRMKAKVAAGAHPWIDGWNAMIADRLAQDDYRPAPKANMPSRQRAQDDARAMYYNALRWYITGEVSHAECAVRIANAWSSVVNTGPAGDALSGIPVGSFAIAGELLRTYPGWKKEDFERFKKMLTDHWTPKSEAFLKTHWGSPPSRSWANWDACNMVAVLATAVLCDDQAKFDFAVNYFKNGAGMGAIRNAVPFRYPGGLGQWQESGRDHAHAMGGQGLLAEFCQIAWNQGVDLFGYNDNALLAGAEYEAQYTLWKGVPYTFYDNADQAHQQYISTNYHGRLEAAHFELIYNHYVVGQGLSAPHVRLFAELKRPEDAIVDIFGYGTLTFTLDAAASPYPVFGSPPVPRDLVATAGIGCVELRWAPSGAYNARGYEVFRATSREGPFASVHSIRGWTTPLYTDRDVANGTTYYYAVTALNQMGNSDRSEPASATPVEAGALPEGMTAVDIGGANTTRGDRFARVANNAYVVMSTGAGIGGPTDSCHFLYRQLAGDGTLTARIVDRHGGSNKIGLMMREGPEADAKAVVVTLGEIGGRQARSGFRESRGARMAIQHGNDYTWLPIWFRLRRQGNDFTAYQSPDGIVWYKMGAGKVAMGNGYLAGMVGAAGGNPAEPPTIIFDNVTFEESPPVPPAAPGSLTATSSGGSTIRLNWTYPAGSNHQKGFKVEGSSDDKLFYEIADLPAGATSFENTGVSLATGHYYRVRAYNTGGYSDYTNSAGIAAPGFK